MPQFHEIKKIFIGNPLHNEKIHDEKIPKWKALAVLSSDALSSVAYATDEILIPLTAFAASATIWSLPIAAAIATLLIILTVSYRQTIDAYPNGGGAYTVAKENLGQKAGLIAGASLLIDYTLTVAVSVASGIENIISAFPGIAEHQVIACILIIFVIMLLNLRGVRESANIFTLPTYFFIFSVFLMVGVGIFRMLTGTLVQVHPVLHEAYPAIPIFLILRAFSSGCSALTGVEAITNSIAIFQTPAQSNAKKTMIAMSLTLGLMFLGITMIAHVVGISPQENQTVISLVAQSVFGRTGLYYAVQISTALILFLAANTAYADFPRLSSLLAYDKYLPRQLGSLGDRLVYSNGIIGLSVFAMLMVVLFGGQVHHLIPLYAIGVFLSFTLSQSGMVVHHIKYKETGWRKGLVINAIGALSTSMVLIVISMSKFMDGAWMVLIFIPVLVALFMQIHKHYTGVAKQLSAGSVETMHPPVASLCHTAILPLSGLHPGVMNAAQYALSISKDVRAIYVELDPKSTERLQTSWKKWAPDIQLVVLRSPYRSLVRPILEYVDQVKNETKDEMLTVIIPEFVTAHWYQGFLHNQTALMLKAVLLFRKGVVVTSVRYHLN